MRGRWLKTVAVVIGVAGSRMAAADESDGARDDSFVFLDRFDSTSRIGVTYLPAFMSVDGGPGDHAEASYNVHAQVVDARSGLGLYVQQQAMSGNYTGGADPGLTRSAAEAGIGYVLSLNCVSSLVVRAGVGIPRSGSGAEAYGPGNPGLAKVARYARPTDAVTFIAAYEWSARVSGSWLYVRDALFARVDVGVDVPSGYSLLGHINAGVGYAFRHVSLAAELSTLQGTFTANKGIDDLSSLVFVGASATVRADRWWRPFAAALMYAGSVGSGLAGAYEPAYSFALGLDLVLPALR